MEDNENEIKWERAVHFPVNYPIGTLFQCNKGYYEKVSNGYKQSWDNRIMGSVSYDWNWMISLPKEKQIRKE